MKKHKRVDADSVEALIDFGVNLMDDVLKDNGPLTIARHVSSHLSFLREMSDFNALSVRRAASNIKDE